MAPHDRAMVSASVAPLTLIYTSTLSAEGDTYRTGLL